MPLGEGPRDLVFSSYVSLPFGFLGVSSSARNVLASRTFSQSWPDTKKRGNHAPPYSPAVTSARKADRVSRAMTRLPTAA